MRNIRRTGNDGASSTTAFTLTITSPYATWQGSRFTAPDIATGLTTLVSDFDRDGMANLLEYAFGTNPKLADAAGIAPNVSGNKMQASFPCDSARTDITYTVQASSTLAGNSWTDIAKSVGGATTLPIGSLSTVSDTGVGLRLRQSRVVEAVAAMAAGLKACREDPWVKPDVLFRSLGLLEEIALATNPEAYGAQLQELVEKPFSVFMQNDRRQRTLFRVSQVMDQKIRRSALAASLELEPNIPWDRDLLTTRERCCRLAGHPLAAKARGDLESFYRATPLGVPPPTQEDSPASSPPIKYISNLKSPNRPDHCIHPDPHVSAMNGRMSPPGIRSGQDAHGPLDCNFRTKT